MPMVERLVVSAGNVRVLVVTVEVDADTVAVRARGELDAYATPSLDAALATAEALLRGRVVVDLTGVTHLGAASVAVLHGAAERARSVGAELAVETGDDRRLEHVLAHLPHAVLEAAL